MLPTFSCLLASTKINLMPILIVHCTFQSTVVWLCQVNFGGWGSADVHNHLSAQSIVYILNRVIWRWPLWTMVQQISVSGKRRTNGVRFAGTLSRSLATPRVGKHPLPGILTHINFRENDWPLEINCAFVTWLFIAMTIFGQLSDGESCIDCGRGV